MTSWKTTVVAILVALVAVLNIFIAMWDGDPATEPNWTMAATAVMAAVGLFFARDNDKTSEQSGAAAKEALNKQV